MLYMRVSLVVFATFGVLIAFASKRIQDSWQDRICQGDSLLVNIKQKNWDLKTSIDPCHVFSETYYEARSKFRTAATAAGATLYPLQVLSEGESDLTIDVAVLRGKSNGGDSGLVVHTSGVHGVEGYAGSSIQVAFLESIIKEIQERSDHPTFVFVHAVNPYGMAHFRRPNENNVDLNRNAMHPDDWATVQFAPEGPYEAYGRLDATFFNPAQPPNFLYVYVRLFLKAAMGIMVHGFDTLKKALVTGQYYNSKGLFYGGSELQSSYRILYDFFENTLLVTTDLEDETNGNKLSEESCCKGTITWLDVHTGLGPSGKDSFLLDSSELEPGVQKALEDFFPDAPLPTSSKDAEDARKGYEFSKGFTSRLFSRLFQEPEHRDPLFLVQEFGTVPGILVAHALISENMAYQYLTDADQKVAWAKATTRRAFYVQTPAWRRSILERGLTVLLQAAERH